MTIFLIVAFALYVVLATSVSQTARSNSRNRLQWFLAALAINPVIAQLLLLSRVSGSRLANPDRSEAPSRGRLAAAGRSVI